MTPKERFRPFAAGFGKRLAELGFPEKITLSNYCYKVKTSFGYIGLFAIPNYRSGDSYSVSLSCAVSHEIVQNILVKTELYHWSGGLTWTCGADLRTIRNEAGAIRHADSWTDAEGRVFFDLEQLDVLSRQQDVWIDPEPSAADYEYVCDLAWNIVKGWAWPFFQDYALSDEALLKLCIRNDSYSKLFFLEPRKPLTGMILARHLGEEERIPELVEQARTDYGLFALRGNRDPIDKFMRIAAEIGFGKYV